MKRLSLHHHKLNPILIKSDDHTYSNRNGIEAVNGKEFLENHTSSCLYNFDKSVKKTCLLYFERAPRCLL